MRLTMPNGWKGRCAQRNIILVSPHCLFFVKTQAKRSKEAKIHEELSQTIVSFTLLGKEFEF